MQCLSKYFHFVCHILHYLKENEVKHVLIKDMYWLSQLNRVIKFFSDPHHIKDLDLIILYFVFYTLVSEIIKSG